MEMPSGMAAGGNMAAMQRPQPGNIGQQYYAQILRDLRSSMHQLPPGWQRTFDVNQRAARIMQLFTMLRSIQPDPAKCMPTAQTFESRTFMESATQDIYLQLVARKMAEVTQRRGMQVQIQQHQQQNGMGAPMNMANGVGGMNAMPMAMNNNLNNMNMANMGMGMPLNNMQMQNAAMQPNAAGQQQRQFPNHLQRPMQPSVPPQQPQQQQQQQQHQHQQQQHQPQQQQQQQPSHRQVGNTMDPSMLQTPQMPQQMTLNNQMSAAQPNGMGQASAGQAGATVQNEIMMLARRWYAQIPEEKKVVMRQNLLAPMTEQQRANQGHDVVFKMCVARARDALMKSRAGFAGGQGSGDLMAGQGNPALQQQQQQHQHQQQQRHQQQQQQQQQLQMMQNQSSQQADSNFDMSQLAGLQAQALKQQESGEQVVPASNNPNANFAGQRNATQGTSLQTSSNLGGQQSTNPQAMTAAQFMQVQQQQQRQRQEQAQQQNRAGQQMSLAQQNQLHGQPGGLNAPNPLTGGQANSPAMNMTMLNRPMAPPGQSTPAPATPQQNRPGIPPTQVNGANNIAQHYQNMINHPQAGSQQALLDQQLMSMPPAIREQLANVPPEQAALMIARYTAMRNQGANQGMANMQPGPTGVPPNVNMPAMSAPSAQQQAMMAGMPANMVPNMANNMAQLNGGQTGLSQQTMATNAQFQQRLNTHQQNLMRQRAMDLRPFPKAILARLGIQIPSHVLDWGKLKQYIQANQGSLVPGCLEKVQLAQAQFFEARPDEMALAMQTLQQHLQNAQAAGMSGQQPQQGLRNAPQAMQNGQSAPSAPMGTPAMQMQPPQNRPMPSNMAMNQGRALQPPSQQELNMYREKVPHFQNVTDDQLRSMIMRKRMATMQGIPAMQPGQTPQGVQNAQLLGQPGAMIAQGQQQRHMQQQAAAGQQQPGAQMQGQKRPSVSDDVMEIPNPNATQGGALHGQATPLQQQQQQQLQLQQAQLLAAQRLRAEDFQKMSPQQRAEMMRSMQKMRDASKTGAGMANDKPQPQQTTQPLPQQQQPPAGVAPSSLVVTAQDRQRIAILNGEVVQGNPKGPPVKLDADSQRLAQQMLKKLWSPAVVNMEKTFLTALKLPGFGESRVKEAMRAKLVVQQNAIDDQGTINKYLSVTPQDLRRIEQWITHYLTQLRSMNDQMKASTGRNMLQQQGSGAQAQAPAQQPQAPPPQLQQPARPASDDPSKPQAPPPMGRNPSQSGQGRKAPLNSKVPPAPTEDKKMDWNPSPHGVPKYDAGRTELTIDKLKFPPTKKRRTQAGGDSAASTPNAQPGVLAVSPSPSLPVSAGKPSPETARKMQQAKEQQQQLYMQQQQMQQMQQQKAAAARAQFRCQDAFCDASVHGFETQEKLTQHIESEHKTVDDPFAFLLESAAAALDVDADGNPRTKTKAAAPTKPRPGSSVRTPAPAVGATPKAKSDHATPATPSSGNKQRPITTAAGKKPTEIQGTTDGEATLLDTMAAKAGFELAEATEETKTDTKPDIDADWMSLVQGALLDDGADLGGNNAFFGGAGSSLDDDWSDLRTVTHWGLPTENTTTTAASSSPDLTPASGTSSSSVPSSHDSDVAIADRLRIAFSWDAFGNGDTGVPETLLSSLDLDEAVTAIADVSANKAEDDTAMADASKADDNAAPSATAANADADADAGAKKSTDSWDWSADLADWDAVYGADAGLLGDDAFTWSVNGVGFVH